MHHFQLSFQHEQKTLDTAGSILLHLGGDTSQYGCKDTVNALWRPYLKLEDYFVPNVFTPNG
jgi:hypothetical protein